MALTWALPIDRAHGQGTSPAAPSVKITDVRLGFEDTFRPSKWVPLSFDIVAVGTPFQGDVLITVPDDDGVDTTLALDNVTVPANGQATVRHYVRIDNTEIDLDILLRDPEGKRVARWESQQKEFYPNVLNESARLIVGIGRPVGLADLDDAEPDQLTSVSFVDRSVVSVLRLDDLPTQWFAYGSVDTLVLTTHEQSVLDALDPARASAIETWVMQGGHLVVSVANNWQVVAESFLGRMLPATLDGIETVGRLSPQVQTLESMVPERNSDLPVGETGMITAQLTKIRGNTLPKDNPDANKTPLLVRGLYGFGTVTLVGVDVSEAPFRDWPAARGFWQSVLELPAGTDGDADNAMIINDWNRSDIGQWIDNKLSNFNDVTVVPFSWVAMLILGYIALIGPIDYFFLKRVVGRLEWTWLTFPLVVVGVSVGAYYAAYWLKGDQLRLNRIDVVDIDQTTGAQRGQSFVSIFSPVIGRYSLTTEPGLGAGGTWESLGMGRAPLDRVVSAAGPLSMQPPWMTQPSGGLFGMAGYSYAGAEPSMLFDAPIKVWSVKSFRGQWLAAAGESVEASLHAGDPFKDQLALIGTLTNRLDVPIQNAVMLWGDLAYVLGNLKPGTETTLTIEMQKPRSGIFDELTDQHPNQPVHEFAYQLTMSSRDGDKIAKVGNISLSEWSMRHALETGRAILVGTLEAPGGKLWLNQRPEQGADPPPISGVEDRTTILRILMEPSRP